MYECICSVSTICFKFRDLQSVCIQCTKKILMYLPSLPTHVENIGERGDCEGHWIQSLVNLAKNQELKMVRNISVPCAHQPLTSQCWNSEMLKAVGENKHWNSVQDFCHTWGAFTCDAQAVLRNLCVPQSLEEDRNISVGTQQPAEE